VERIVVTKVIKGRYAPGVKPLSWDQRAPGVDIVETREGRVVELSSKGGQSTPGIGWELMLQSASPTGVEWTLYGIRAPEDSGLN